MLDFILLDNVRIFTVEQLNILIQDLTSYTTYYESRLDKMSKEQYVKQNAEAVVNIQDDLSQEKKDEFISIIRNN